MSRSVSIGNAFRVASLVKGGQEAVGGVVVARSGVNPRELIDRVKAKIKDLEAGLPPGVKIVPFYDRSELIDNSIDTLRHALIEEILLVTLAHIIFLAHFRSILIVTLPLPLAVLSSFLILYYLNVTSNIMSLAGIAIAIGVLVDAGIVVTENAFRHLEQAGIDTRDRHAVWQTVLDVDQACGPSHLLFDGDHPAGLHSGVCADGPGRQALSPSGVCQDRRDGGRHGDRGNAGPRAVHAVAAAAKSIAKQDNPVMRVLQWIYRPVLRWALAASGDHAAHRVDPIRRSGLSRTRIGSEFMPPLNEGDLMFMPIADPSISLARKHANRGAAGRSHREVSRKSPRW